MESIEIQLERVYKLILEELETKDKSTLRFLQEALFGIEAVVKSERKTRLLKELETA
jgi:hypothetical protein